VSYGTFFEGVSGGAESHSSVAEFLALIILVGVGIALWVRHG
jgi:hypothetical protein